ncbi:MAG: hypothetical protein APF76_08105 [Desulfitibacter sp. BRH_c19]|nr:MAG: hypothetical protein APF76_08105 [Desulfitibacter sp. BRH_c19]
MKKTINAQTKLLGLIGSPVGHSLSPMMHNHLLGLLDLNYVYTAFDLKPELLGDGVKGLVALGARGFNVTVPHKEKILPFLDEIEANAKIIGAINTILVENGRTFGYNTDITGFKKSILRAGFSPKGKTVSVLGAGGAARAAIIGLSELEAAVINIINRDQERAQTIIETYEKDAIDNIKNIHTQDTEEALRQSSLVVNATSVGMKGYLSEVSPIPGEYLNNGIWVCDLVYNPLETIFLKEAKRNGCIIIDGLDMLVHQGADAFKIWTGVEPPRQEIKKFLINQIANGY